MACLSSLPATLNLQIYQGTSNFQGGNPLIINWESGGVPVNLTNYTAVMKLKSGTDTILELNTENDRITIDGATGTITLTVDAEDTTLLTPSNPVYDLMVISPAGVTTVLLYGIVTIRQGVSI